eukprot:TRINITY_DN4607_c0_g1_i10.p1 TRINITY_DN4607_c0_g1~~TRINITY_DN4607_c0_g1_i10.p1  ORF type:complete len:224 (-),score=55.41 TRINITY_DN4607_c0_g1_i10:10-681(-)
MFGLQVFNMMVCGSCWLIGFFFFFQAEDGIRDVERSRGLGDVYKRQVLVGKTLEQARLEVDEDAEIEAIRKYKSEYAERRQIERDDMEAMVEEERKRLIKKNDLLQREREKREKQEVAMRKLQCLHIAKAYLKNTLHNSMETMISSNFWQNEELEEIHNKYIPKVVDNVSHTVAKKKKKKKNEIKKIHYKKKKPTTKHHPKKPKCNKTQTQKQKTKRLNITTK